MNKYVLAAFVVCLCVLSVHAQGRGSRNGGQQGERSNPGEARGRPSGRPGGGRRNWRKWSKASRQRWMSLKNTWSVALPNGAVAEEVAFLREADADAEASPRKMENKMWMMSRSDNLQGAGLVKSFTMADFNAGILGIRVELPDNEVTTPTPTGRRTNWRQRMRFWKRKNHACFIVEMDVSISEAGTELKLRNSAEAPIPMGSEKTMYAQFQNAVTKEELKGTAVGRLCGRAARNNMAFRLVNTDDGLLYGPTTFTVLGQIDASQQMVSVPLKIFVDSNIDLGDNDDAPPLE